MDTQAACIAVLGTGSDVGKSVVATALCRIFARRGLRVAPFKAQNMSNNSGVTPEGLEMGRAQIVQAEAARVAPHVDMNPILLKPTSDMGAQVVVLGRPLIDAQAKEYYRHKQVLWEEACAALDRLRRLYDLVVMEGAGSCAEVNLLAKDIVNLPMAAYAQAPAILVADIHRGGVFAQVVGTLACLEEKQRKQIRGVIVNRFRGDLDLFKDGVAWIAGRTGLPVYGVLPWFNAFAIEAEDAVVIEQPAADAANGAGPCIAVIRLPHIANFTDLDPLMCLPGLGVVYLEKARDLKRFQAVILPGPGSSEGLDLLPVETELKAPKTTTLTCFSWGDAAGEGYEIHMGQTRRLGGRPLFAVHARNQSAGQDGDGCASDDGRILGTYLHGLFDSPGIARRWLAGIGLDHVQVSNAHGPVARDRAYDALAEHALHHLDMAGVENLIEEGRGMKRG
ncbi:MAG: cobyric acid synthase [Desulfatitalea sp.]|nr:cobyric acid synthase [Desulfatitalea sp.]